MSVSVRSAVAWVRRAAGWCFAVEERLADVILLGGMALLVTLAGVAWGMTSFLSLSDLQARTLWLLFALCSAAWLFALAAFHHKGWLRVCGPLLYYDLVRIARRSRYLLLRFLYAVLLGLFASVASVLAAIGIYGVLAYAVMQRTQEIGIRMALGAQRGQVLALVLRKGLILTTIGVGVGLVGAAIGTRALDGMLFGITPLDAKTFLAVSLTFGLVAAFASYVPARRATKVDPVVALRGD